MEHYTAAEYKKAWRKSNSIHLKQYQHQYLEKHNVPVQCDVCSGRYKKYNKAIHLHSAKHLQVIQANADLLGLREMQNKITELEARLHACKNNIST